MQRSNCAGITERLAVRVKGLTALFCILLLTTAVRPDFSYPCRPKREKTREWHHRTTPLRRCDKTSRHGW
ncbi:hypothetical protein HL667_02780 [Bradyrhizobium sp. 83012]|uniref:Secreted protein n=1 Tax=Bradyrhizobium aeschynomenes TaxID=2734909 RepID=A0ABX2C6L9_9BRAD|nr:hypothetical protein [Bradyrhizobium aeschynomenes]NPU63916.1 hypothetical protein [Bradyrhizobium aeschynomenes]NPV23181.1 hypothetical protein [Bradyrhizobium aeschynomenes]